MEARRLSSVASAAASVDGTIMIVSSCVATL